ncbi:MAG: membrane protein insertion efficiency factor YidD [Proteobacteria bacterium]|nr:MAG: membrane protein insertion efficiency factor YidD [Pseudomonadota bacterium]
MGLKTLQHTTRAERDGDNAQRPHQVGSWRRVVALPAEAVISLLVLLVRGYQAVISPALAPRCRFHPSCSAYAIGALRRHGLLKGSLRAAWRLLRCNPFGKGGYDPP